MRRLVFIVNVEQSSHHTFGTHTEGLLLHGLVPLPHRVSAPQGALGEEGISVQLGDTDAGSKVSFDHSVGQLRQQFGVVGAEE